MRAPEYVAYTTLGWVLGMCRRQLSAHTSYNVNEYDIQHYRYKSYYGECY